MISSQVQEPQILGLPTSLHMGPTGTPPHSTAAKPDVDKTAAVGAYGAYGQPMQSLSPPVGGASLADIEAQNRFYGLPVAFASGFRPFYISLPGAPPIQMAALPNPGQEMYQSSAPQNIPAPHGSQAYPPLSLPHGGSPHDISGGPVGIPSQAHTGHRPIQPNVTAAPMHQQALQQQAPPLQAHQRQHSQPQHQHQHQHHIQLQHQLQHQPQHEYSNQHLQHAPQQQLSPSILKEPLSFLGRHGSAAQRAISRTSQSGPDAYPYRHKDPQLSKRTKVSRACDECRRKKTRCDVDAEHEICTPCARAGVPCTFARAQLKRGPAKKRLSQGTLPLPRIHNSLNGGEQGAGGSISGPHPASRKQRSQSDVVPKALPSIEALLGYGSNAPISPRSFAPSGASSTPVSASAPTNSGFPMLVEVACRQSESPTQESKPAPMEVESSGQGSDGEFNSSVANSNGTSNNTSTSTSTSGNGSNGLASQHTPPSTYDAGVHGVSHGALMEYYTFVHPTFPLLPDRVADFDAMFRSAGSSKKYIVSALNGTSTDVPFGLGNAGLSNSAAARESHLIALLFTYLRTLDSAWLGASVAASTALMTSHGNESLNESSVRLTALVVIFDRLHCAVFDTPSLIPECLLRAAQLCTRLAPTLRVLGLDDRVPAEEESEQFATATQATLKILGNLIQHRISVQESQEQLRPLVAQLQRTPLEQFASVIVKRPTAAA